MNARVRDEREARTVPLGLVNPSMAVSLRDIPARKASLRATTRAWFYSGRTSPTQKLCQHGIPPLLVDPFSGEGFLPQFSSLANVKRDGRL